MTSPHPRHPHGPTSFIPGTDPLSVQPGSGVVRASMDHNQISKPFHFSGLQREKTPGPGGPGKTTPIMYMRARASSILIFSFHKKHPDHTDQLFSRRRFRPDQTPDHTRTTRTTPKEVHP